MLGYRGLQDILFAAEERIHGQSPAHVACITEEPFFIERNATRSLVVIAQTILLGAYDIFFDSKYSYECFDRLGFQ